MSKTFKNFKYPQLKNTPNNITARMGPTEARAIRPKPSSEEDRPFITEETPIPKARIKGTVIGPVVTPPESRDIGRNSAGVIIATRRTIL